jgi:hypothetical protein
MSTHYLIDAHTAILGDARILDVVEANGGQSNLNGGFVVRVPDYIAVKDPVGLLNPVNGLLPKKYAGLLAYYAGFQYVTWDDLLDTSGVDFTYPLLRGTFGDRVTTSLPPGGVFCSTLVGLSGIAPQQALVTWETFSVSLQGDAATRTMRAYTEEAAGGFTCQVSFDNGASFYAVQDGNVLNIPAIGQGTSFIIRFTNISVSPLYLGSWAVVY